jgi:hypothetical protein
VDFKNAKFFFAVDVGQGATRQIALRCLFRIRKWEKKLSLRPTPKMLGPILL